MRLRRNAFLPLSHPKVTNGEQPSKSCSTYRSNYPIVPQRAILTGLKDLLGFYSPQGRMLLGCLILFWFSYFIIYLSEFKLQTGSTDTHK